VRPLFIYAVFLLFATHAFAQLPDSTATPLIPDSLKAPLQKIDSIRNGFNSEVQHLQADYQAAISRIDAQAVKLNHKIDSLNNLRLPSGKLSARLDSLNAIRKKTVEKLNMRLSDLKSRTVDKLSKVELTPGMEGPVGEFTSKINGFKIADNDFIKIPPLEINGISLPDVNGLPDISGLNDLGKISGLSQIETPLGDAGQVAEQLKGVSEDVKNIAQGNLEDVTHIPDAIEQQAENLDAVRELQKQSGIVDEYKDQLQNLNDPEALKKQALEMAKKEAINHFAGKEEQLKAAMDKISKYKQKYSSVSSLKDLPKRPPNAMKGKPLIERIVPGVYFQFQHKNAYLLDINPYVGYKLSGRFFTGLGWNQRFAYDKKQNGFIPEYRIFGPRTFVDFRLGKGFIAHAEAELMNTFVPTSIKVLPEIGSREWIWSFQMGMKKQYKIYKNLNGTVLLQYNFINQYFKTPYVDRLNSRIGFEYNLKKKVKKAAE
jgi:hypothetical protein